MRRTHPGWRGIRTRRRRRGEPESIVESVLRQSGGLPLTRVATLAGYVRYLRSLGVPVDRDLRRARLPTLFYDTPDGWISYLALRRFCFDVSRREGLWDLGLGVRPLDTALHSSFRESFLGAPTLKLALQRMSADVHLQNTGMKLSLQFYPDRARLSFRLPLSRDLPDHGISETRVARLAERSVRAFCGPGFTPTTVFLSALQKDLPYDMEFAFNGASVITGQREGAIEFPRALLATRMKRTPGGSVKAQPIDGTPSPSPQSISASLQACLTPYLSGEPVSIELAAEISGLSVRTLQRRMKKEGTSFSQVIDDARCRVALARLAGGDVSLAQLAAQLGYSEHSAFTRAFHRWTGMTPRRYRAHCLRKTPPESI